MTTKADCEQQLRREGFRLLPGSRFIWIKGEEAAHIHAYNLHEPDEHAEIRREKRLELI